MICVQIQRGLWAVGRNEVKAALSASRHARFYETVYDLLMAGF